MRALCAALGAAFALAAAAPAQPAPAAGGRVLTLEEAVATAFAHDPQLALSAEQVAAQQAALLEARGLFDRRFGLRSSFDYRIDELFGGRLQSERDRRLRLEIPPPIFEEVARKLVDRLPIAFGDREPGSLLFPDCTQATTFFILRDPETDSIQSVLCFDDNDQLLGILGRGANGEDLNALNLSGLFDDLSGIDERLDEFVRAQLGLAADEMRTIAIALRQAAATLRLQRLRLGVVPEDVETIRFDFGVDWQHRFRTGTRLISTVDFASAEDNYIGKKLTPAFGDSFAPNSFSATFGVALDVPLGRGGGRTSAEAPLRAAEQNLAAARALHEHVAAQRALSALEAYWDAAAAERRLALIESSRVTQERLLAAGEELVEADVLPRIDLARSRARLADTVAQTAAARQSLLVARLELARTLGLPADGAAPAAAEQLERWLEADPLAGAELEGLAARALDERADARAAAALTAANLTLAEAARADLRPLVALSLQLSYNAFHETFKDRFYDVESFYRALDDRFAGPSYGLGLRFRLPAGNHAARGRLLQAEASTQQSRVSEGDLRRTIRLRVAELTAELARARAELDIRREALGYLEETHQASIERYQAGDLTVIDTLLTEQQLTQARLDVVEAERRWLSLVAQIRFETGALVELPEAAESLAGARLRPLGDPIL